MITRFAPSPTGPLHLGHAFSALLASDLARRHGGTFLLRIEDIDQTRSRPDWEAQIYEDLAWLGLAWPDPVRRQSDHGPAYRDALQVLWQKGLLYPCTCTRKDIQAAASAPQEGAPLVGPDGIVYPGTCRPTAPPTGAMHDTFALRLNMRLALQDIANGCFSEIGDGADGQSGRLTLDHDALLQGVGDVVLSRKDFLGSYHLSVVIDDAAQGITHVVRGEDLFTATPIHVVLQALLGLPTPIYHHHRLIRDDAGKRLAKRDDARAIATYRQEGATPDDIRRLVGLPVIRSP